VKLRGGDYYKIPKELNLPFCKSIRPYRDVTSSIFCFSSLMKELV